VLFNGIINASVKNIATMTVNDDQGVRDDGLELLIELVKANGLLANFPISGKADFAFVAEPMAESIRSAVVDSVQSGLSKYEDQPRISTIQFVEKLSMLQRKYCPTFLRTSPKISLLVQIPTTCSLPASAT
jgi:hypothetical protein